MYLNHGYVVLWLPPHATAIPINAENSHPSAMTNLVPFEEAPALTQEQLAQYNVVNLESINLAEFSEGPDGLEFRKNLARKLERSITTLGFFNVVNTGFPKEQLKRLQAISQLLLTIPDEEKAKYLAGSFTSDQEDRSKSMGGERGQGFKPKGYWAMQNGVRDSIVHYNFRNMLHDDLFLSEEGKNMHPSIIGPYIQEVGEYYKFLHFSVLKKITVLCDLILELPEGTLWEKHFKVYPNNIFESGGGFGRSMMYHGMAKDESEKTQNTWLRGHSDGSAFTFITSQPVLSLQVRDHHTGEWKYVGHRPESLIVNIGDAMEFVTGGYFKSTIHRVVAPPVEQQGFKRLVLIYFCDCAYSTPLSPEHLKSPKLLRKGYTSKDEWEDIIFAQWYEEKGRLFGKRSLNDVKGDEPNIVRLFGRDHERWHHHDKGEPKYVDI